MGKKVNKESAEMAKSTADSAPASVIIAKSVLTTTDKSISTFNPDPTNKSKLRSFWFILCGCIVAAIWLTLFVAGLLVDSGYYRAAISYGFDKIMDWISAILSFTLSNVIILAFLAGLLGGIISKLRVTKSFTIPNNVLIADEKINPMLYENPFISAFRGMFIFVAIMFMQYVSSFNDLGTISKNAEETQSLSSVKYENLFNEVRNQIKDSTTLANINKVLLVRESGMSEKSMDSVRVSKIFLLTDSIKYLPKKDSLLYLKNKQALKTKIRTLRRSLKVPSNADFAGIGVSSFSYFKFAVIISFLAFIFGYDPTRFTSFLGKQPFFSRDQHEDKDKSDTK